MGRGRLEGGRRHVSSGILPLVTLASVIPSLAAALSLCSPQQVPQSPERLLLRQLYGDLAVEVRTKVPGTLILAAADARSSLVLTLLATDARRWADSAARILAAPAPGRGRSATWEAEVAGPGVSAGSISLSRRVAPGDTAIVLLVTDASFQGVRTELTMENARALTQAMRRAAAASVARPPRQPPR